MTSGSYQTHLPVPEFIDNNLRHLRKEPHKKNDSLRAKKPPKLCTKFHEASLNRSLNSSTPHAISFRENSDQILSPIYKRDTSLSYFEQCFDVISKIGEGSFGEVFKVRSKEDGLLYAIKKSKQFFRSEKYRQEQLQEVKRYEEFSGHEHCVTLYKAWEQDDRLFMQMELCRGNLESYYAEERSLPEETIWSVLHDLLLALKSLHDKNLIHLDIKLDNILIGEDGYYKLADFGLVVDVDYANNFQTTEGDSRYVAPEVLQGRFSKSADMFSLGIAILELSCNLELPPNGPLWQQLRYGILPDEFIKTISPELRDVIKWMMSPHPLNRPSVDQLLFHRKLIAIHKYKRQFLYLHKIKYTVRKTKRFLWSKLCNLRNYLSNLLIQMFLKIGLNPSKKEERLQDNFYEEFSRSPGGCMSSTFYSRKIINSTPVHSQFRKSRKDLPRFSFGCENSDADEFNSSIDDLDLDSSFVPADNHHEPSSFICKKLFFQADESD